MDTTHLDALQLRLSHERVHLSNAKTEDERKLRQVWIKQIEKEIASEYQLMGDPLQLPPMTDEELLRQLDA